jgi:hypothetical protein
VGWGGRRPREGGREGRRREGGGKGKVIRTQSEGCCASTEMANDAAALQLLPVCVCL